MADFYEAFHNLFYEVSLTNRQLLERFEEKDGLIYALLLRQKAALSHAMEDYLMAMKKEEKNN